MSYLSPSGHRRAAHTAVRPLRFGVPGFAHPLLAPAEWGELVRSDVPVDWVVLGAGSPVAPHGASGGPGARPDPYCLTAVTRLREAGVRVLGHLDTAFGERPFAELLSEAQRYLNWYKVDGFSLDASPTGPAALPVTRRTVNTLRTLLDRAYVVLQHGIHPCSGYAALADQLVTFRGPWAAYRWSQVPEWTAGHPPERFCHLVHGVPRSDLDEALRLARRRGAATVYVTDRATADGADPWEVLPGYWDDLVSRIGPGVSE
ncbi:spherulation-specific family 4 protein [Streptomyces sp. UNOC14_S4]|uniref:spherulation-specific family 4 protein n=1 Tax=Streptomyces sp. UNOC14_S4 TaxID=2872340 RepID=UPI001E522A4B|nr:spherulation-specific family 4 protein [Streptomyces sp. UNOC14_S4]MCC3772427.1 spherulation-specific family 4 protein [Streptomyces sp. UNOC14_S4]